MRVGAERTAVTAARRRSAVIAIAIAVVAGILPLGGVALATPSEPTGSENLRALAEPLAEGAETTGPEPTEPEPTEPEPAPMPTESELTESLGEAAFLPATKSGGFLLDPPSRAQEEPEPQVQAE
jgi:hypothetical protein